MTDIDRTIEGVEQLYRSLTGHPPTNGEAPHDVIPPEADPARYVELQMERLIGMLAQRSAPERQAWAPPLSLWESDDVYLAIIDLPGVPRDSVKVSVAGQGLMVQAIRPAREGEVPEDARLRYQERSAGPCARMVPLPADAALEHVSARMVEGSLYLRVPRAAARHHIEVQ